MAKYRSNLPQMKGGDFLTDGGMETVLIFQEGVDLPHFASFPLLDSAGGRAHLTKYYENYLAIASKQGVGFVLDSATWRASPDWGAVLGYSPEALKATQIASIALLEELRAKWENPASPIVLNGVLGPRGDGYKAGRMEAGEAADYHAAQIETFAGTEADMVSAITMNNVNEAIGIASAAKAASMPCVVAFTVETDGRLATGQPLGEAIAAVDAATGRAALHFGVNCAHPDHFTSALEVGDPAIQRIGLLRANASRMSHAELDEADELDDGDPVELAGQYAALRDRHPHLEVLGGCCGTDTRHVRAIAAACV